MDIFFGYRLSTTKRAMDLAQVVRTFLPWNQRINLCYHFRLESVSNHIHSKIVVCQNLVMSSLA